jgi:hypothetical protein
MAAKPFSDTFVFSRQHPSFSAVSFLGALLSAHAELKAAQEPMAIAAASE